MIFSLYQWILRVYHGPNAFETWVLGVYSRFPDSNFPGWSLSRKDVSRMVILMAVDAKFYLSIGLHADYN